MRTDHEVCLSPACAEGGLAEDQRIHVRFLCGEGSVLRLAVRPTYRGHRAILLDISVGGVGLLMAQPLEIGTRIAIDLRDPTDDGLTRLAHVAHVRPNQTPPDAPWLPKVNPLRGLVRRLFSAQPARLDPCWFVGCQFDSALTEDQLQRLLAGGPDEDATE